MLPPRSSQALTSALSPHFAEQQTCEMESPRILVTDRKINNMNELVRARFPVDGALAVRLINILSAGENLT